MSRIYKDTPDNFSQIQPYIITDAQTAAQHILTAPRCYFYDTCAFRRHMRLAAPQCLFDYIKATNGIVVVTRSIIMELCSANGNLSREPIEYFHQMHAAGLTVLVIFEEDLFNALSLYTSSVEYINNFLSIAVKHVKLETGVVSQVLATDRKLRQKILADAKCTDRSLFHRFFSSIRASKTSGDNLGEELILIGIHMLTNIPENVSYKYILLTDDKAAVGMAGTVMKNVQKHIGQHCIAAFTTPKLAQNLWNDQFLSQKDQLEKFLLPANSSDPIRILCAQEYELELTELSLSAADLANRIADDSGFRVVI